jgi:hypothetical protein
MAIPHDGLDCPKCVPLAACIHMQLNPDLKDMGSGREGKFVQKTASTLTK